MPALDVEGSFFQRQTTPPPPPPFNRRASSSLRFEFGRPETDMGDTVAASPKLKTLDHTQHKAVENGTTKMHHETLVPPAPAMRRYKSTDGTEDRDAKLPLFGQRAMKAAVAWNDTPVTTAPSSPAILPVRQNSGDKANRARPTTLDIPGLTKSSVSPDGRIAPRDVGSKMVIIMVGMPARGKSYITKKMARYLNWLQHDTQIFNVGNRRRVAASAIGSKVTPAVEGSHGHPGGDANESDPSSSYFTNAPRLAAEILMNGTTPAVTTASPEPSHDTASVPQANQQPLPELLLPEPQQATPVTPLLSPGVGLSLDQSAQFFDPENREGAALREQVALGTLDELLDYILNQGGSVGILDATNSTLSRRKTLIRHIRDRAGEQLNVLFIESICLDENLLEKNMRLKLSGPDYKDKDPETSLRDFRKRVEMYEKSYCPLGDWEDRNNIPYVQMIDVGRKVICHQIRGFLSVQAVEYLLNFNLAPRQIWITRHGESEDNVSGKLGGDSKLTPRGHEFARDLAKFMAKERTEWALKQIERERSSRLPPNKSGKITPPNPHYADAEDGSHILNKNFCVWTSMLQRSIETGQYFNEDDFDVKQMRMMNELNAGVCEGLTYDEVKKQHREEFDERKKNKLHYRYHGPGGEGYLDVLNRLRPVISETERMTDHVLLIGHRSVSRILLAYFLGLGRDEITNLDVPIGMLYCLEPKPYGVDYKAYRWNEEAHTFDLQPNYKLRQTSSLD